jgi:hypothetical protein
MKMLPNNYQGLAAFAEHMNAKIVANEPTKGDSWKGTKIEVLIDNLHNDAKRVGEKAEELVDIANMCMMLFNRYMELAQTGINRERIQQ